jgi:ComF family protein
MATPLSAESWLVKLGASLARGAIDLLLPPTCLACENPVERQGLLCAECFPRHHFITAPLCARCGVPFTHPGEAGPDGLCQSCLARPPVFSRARAVWRYDAASRDIILPLKHADRTELAPALARLMATAGRELLEGADLIVPVPLHYRRLVARRYNQAALLARGIGRIVGVAVVPDLLRRVRATPSLGDLGAAERAAVLAGTIAVAPRHRVRLAGRRVVLIDDVLTSGATANECARVLLAEGAAAVDVLVAARVTLSCA